jgi:NAD(P)-dependent dehydrogenase (short-subunit alcohol dehydrogenase family)
MSGTTWPPSMPHLIERGKEGHHGNIVATSSMAALLGLGNGTGGDDAYGAAKLAVIGLVKQYANFLAQYNVRVNGVAPTSCNTPMVTENPELFNVMGKYPSLANAPRRTRPGPAGSGPTSKLENILSTRELHRRYAGRGIRAVAFHPSNVASNFASGTTSNWRLVYGTPLRHVALTSPDKAARTLLWLANGTPGTTWAPGLFYARNKPATPNPQAGDDALAAALWNCSAELAGLTATT